MIELGTDSCMKIFRKNITVYIHKYIYTFILLEKNINVYTHKCTYVPNECPASQRDSHDIDRKINLNRVINLLHNQLV